MAEPGGAGFFSARGPFGVSSRGEGTGHGTRVCLWRQ